MGGPGGTELAKEEGRCIWMRVGGKKVGEHVGRRIRGVIRSQGLAGG